MIHISRKGVILGKYAPDEIAAMLKDGKIESEDYWWMDGMKEWIQVSKEKPPVSSPPPIEVKWGKEDWMRRPPVGANSPTSPLASDKQVQLIKTFGITSPADLTKSDASRWIDNLIDNEFAESARTDMQINREMKRAKEGFGCGGFRTPSGEWRHEMSQYIEEAETRRQEMQESMDEAGRNMKLRVEFWEAVIKTALPEAENGDEDALEIFQLEIGSFDTDPKLLARLVRAAASIGRVPLQSEIETVIRLADSDSKTWDDDNPELVIKKLLGA
jgi:hypothetical protein